MLFLPDGTKYEDDFRNDKYSGSGTLRFYDGDRIKDEYIGSFKDGKFEGKGVYVSKENKNYAVISFDSFVDSLKGDENSLIPNYYMEDYSLPYKYEGDFKNGVFEGKGVYITNNGEDKYEGDFKNNKFDGKGIYTFSTNYVNNDKYKYEGDFKNGVFEGKGTYIYFNHSKYVGNFKNGKYNGKGLITFSGEMIKQYEGDFKNNAFEGKGTILYSNGDRYTGSFKNGLYEDKGTLILSSGEKYSGIFKEGRYVQPITSDNKSDNVQSDTSIKYTYQADIISGAKLLGRDVKYIEYERVCDNCGWSNNKKTKLFFSNLMYLSNKHIDTTYSRCPDCAEEVRTKISVIRTPIE